MRIADQLREETGPCPGRRQETIYYSFAKSGYFPDYTGTERLLGGQKGSETD